jgi:hypothetical protein
MKIEAAQRLQVTALMSNSAAGVRDEIMQQLKAGKYQVSNKSGDILVHNGTIQNVAGAMKYKGWQFNKSRSELTHPQVDYYIKLSEANGVTTVRVVD